MAKRKATIEPKGQAGGVPVYCAFDEIVDVGTLVPNSRNPNRHSDEQIRLLAKIIKHQGWRAPITVSNRSGFIVRGHGRLMAAKVLGASECPVDRQDYATEAEEWADLVADNRLSELSEIDAPSLKDILQELDTGVLEALGGDMGLTAYTEAAMADLMSQFHPDGEPEEVEAPEPPKTPVTQLGDLWICGSHRVMCGDSTDAGSVALLMAGEKADMVFTDPPYGVGYTGGAKPREELAGDEIGTAIYANALPNLKAAAADHAALYLWYADAHAAAAAAAAAAAGYDITAQIIWVKNNAQFVSSAHYHGKHEPCFYAHRHGKSARWNGAKNEVTIWECDRANKNKYHPTQKPVPLAARAITNSTFDGDCVLDLFLGSGTTMIAAEQLGRRAFGMEISEAYTDVSVLRWQKLTGKSPVLEATGQTFEEVKKARGLDE
jgi:DNA modification methylase